MFQVWCNSFFWGGEFVYNPSVTLFCVLYHVDSWGVSGKCPNSTLYGKNTTVAQVYSYSCPLLSFHDAIFIDINNTLGKYRIYNICMYTHRSGLEIL